MTRLDNLLVFAESHKLTVCGASAAMVVAIAWGDWLVPNTSLGFLYLLPILLAAPALRGYQILCLAFVCGYLRESFDPLQTATGHPGIPLPVVFNPIHWVAGSFPRLVVAACGFAATGFFVAELNRRRRLLSDHLTEREEQIRLRREAELQVQTLIETSPLAILTLNHAGQVALANESAHQLLGFESRPLQGEDVTPHLPILSRMLHSQHSGGPIRTNVECRGQRRSAHPVLPGIPRPFGDQPEPDRESSQPVVHGCVRFSVDDILLRRNGRRHGRGCVADVRSGIGYVAGAAISAHQCDCDGSFTN